MLITMVFILLILAGAIWLQIFLSKRNNKWLGLTIPLICFLFSIMAVSSLVIFTSMEVTQVTKSIDGVIVEEIIQQPGEKPGIIAILATTMPVFLISNIPTLIFLTIHFACREKLKLRSELDKMSIQDLG